jgi:hypoxanthine phosphoribosyltransferase
MSQDYEIAPLISADEIATRIDQLAEEINTAFADTNKLVVVGLLRGSFVFIADLARRLSVPVEIDFMETSSYGDGTTSSREVRVLKDLRSPIEGRDVLVVEDIIDTGHTLAHVLGLLRTHRPGRLEICALLDKPSRRETPVTARWIGFEIPDEFVVGYGIDYAQRNRNLPYIGAVRFPEETE